jgi:hypothetical protein
MYGYDIGSLHCENGWHLAEADEYGEWSPFWTVAGDDPIAKIEHVMLRASGFTEPRPDGNWEAPTEELIAWTTRQAEATAALPVTLEYLEHPDYARYALVTWSREATSGEVGVFDPGELLARRLGESWDEKLADMCAALDVTPVHPETRKPVAPRFMFGYRV